MSLRCKDLSPIMKGITVIALFVIAAVWCTDGAPVETEAAASASTAKQPHITPATPAFANPSASAKSSISEHPRHKRRRHHRRRHRLHRHRHKLYPLKDRLQQFVGGTTGATSNLLASVKTPHQDFEMTNGEVFEHGGVPDLRLRQDMSRIGYGIYNEHGDQGEKYATKEDIEPQKVTPSSSNDNLTPIKSPYLAESMNAKHNPLLYESLNEASSSERPSTSLSSTDRGPGYSAEGFGFTPPNGIVRHDVENNKQVKQNLTENTIFLGGSEVGNLGGPGLLGARAFDNDGHLLGANYNADLKNSKKNASNAIEDDSVVLVGQDQKQILKSDPRHQPVSKSDPGREPKAQQALNTVDALHDPGDQPISKGDPRNGKAIPTVDIQNETSIHKKTDVNKERGRDDGNEAEEEDERDDDEKGDERDEDETPEKNGNNRGRYVNDKDLKPGNRDEQLSESGSKYKDHEQLENTRKNTSMEDDEKYTMGIQDLINTKEANKHGITTGIVDPMLCDLAALTMMEEASKEHKDLSNIGLNDVTSLASKCFRKNLEASLKHHNSATDLGDHDKEHNFRGGHKHRYRKVKSREEGHHREVEREEDNRGETEGSEFKEGREENKNEEDEEKEVDFPPGEEGGDHRRNDETSQEDQGNGNDLEQHNDAHPTKSHDESAPTDGESVELNADNVKQGLDDDKVMVGTQDTINIQNRRLSGERMDTLICQMRATRRGLGLDVISRKNCLKDQYLKQPPISNTSSTDVQDLAVLKVSPKGNANPQIEKPDIDQQLLQTPGLAQQLIRPPLPFAWQSLDTRIQNGWGKASRGHLLDRPNPSPLNRQLSREQDMNVVQPPQSHLDSVNFIISGMDQAKGNDTVMN